MPRGSQSSRASDANQPLSLSRDDYVATATKAARAGFIRKVYGILGCQMILTMAVAAPIHMASKEWVMTHVWILYVSIGMLFATMCVMLCCSGVLRKYPQNYAFLFVFTLVLSVVVGFGSAQYTWQSVLLCAGLTGAIFLGLTIYATCTDTDFTGYGAYLFGAMLALMLWSMMCGILACLGVQVKWMVMVYDLLGVLLFMVYIIYDTQLIMGGDHAKFQFGLDDYCFAALNLYMDIINLFLHLLALFGERR